MKKMVLIGALVLSVLAVFACKSQPKSIDDKFKDLIARYSGDLILDGAEAYTVVSTDTLSSIAGKCDYHNSYYYPLILLASNKVVKDADRIDPGMKLTIPNLQKNLNDPNARANIKKLLLDTAKIEDDRKRHDTAEGMRKLSASL